ncbi:MAG: preprotein translocase subunit SecE [Spirosomataceae bacterium]
MNSFIEFVKASWDEVRHNVTWPKSKELQSSTTLVLIGSLIFAAVVGLIDLVFENALSFLYQSF